MRSPFLSLFERLARASTPCLLLPRKSPDAGHHAKRGGADAESNLPGDIPAHGAFCWSIMASAFAWTAGLRR